MELIDIQTWGDLWRITYTRPGELVRYYTFKHKKTHPDELSVLRWWYEYTGAN